MKYLLLLTACVPFLNSCTADPSTGGIFWSESGAQQRLNERQQHLNEVQSDTDRIKANNRAKQRKIHRLEDERKNYQ
jgi:hypothetical protein